ncbi:unnamed protein product [Sphenostylis stenocarpa]|uniref:SWIM-type domain-containing protein n=1 Tax=Sphenostylis stenocarpa TaxID=92480 RepID=A0AA86SHC0_9FABA|nr:unnamed protein product [Sphenostylis stenocarpa]
MPRAQTTKNLLKSKSAMRVSHDLVGWDEVRKRKGLVSLVCCFIAKNEGKLLGSRGNMEGNRVYTHRFQSCLHFLFGKNFEGATRIVDQRGVSKISAHPSGRFIFQVTGESRRKDQYLCFAENFCGCYSFFYDVVNKGEQLCCKHQIAARLAASLGSYVEVKVSDEELAMLLSKI